MADPEYDENMAMQQDEAIALESICGDDFHIEAAYTPKQLAASSSQTESSKPEWNGHFGSLQIRFVLPSKCRLVMPSNTDESTPSSIKPAASIPITHLPPITLRFHMPKTYPDQNPPQFALQASWLTHAQLGLLRFKVDALFRDYIGDVALFAVADAVSSHGLEWLRLLGGDRQDNHEYLLDLRVPPPPPPTANPNNNPLSATSISTAQHIANVDEILTYDRQRTLELFQCSTVTCGICFDARKGDSCVLFPRCAHAYCRECIKWYFEMLVREGEVRSVACPDEDCKRGIKDALHHAVTIDKDLLAEIISEESMDRYLMLMRKQALEGRTDVRACPRVLCQQPVIKEPDDEKLCICSNCGYAFCFFCMKTWHGNQTGCSMERMKEIVDEYKNADPEQKRRMELQYGKKTLDKVIKQMEEAVLNAEWLQNNSQRCPSCSAPVSRSEGCAHMTCRVCQTHFCFLCGQWLDAKQPYAHYSNVLSPCFGSLFQGVDVNNFPAEFLQFDHDGDNHDGNQFQEEVE